MEGAPAEDEQSEGAESGACTLALGPKPKSLPARVVAEVEQWLIVVVIALMAILPTLEVIGRKFFGRGVQDGAVYVQHLTIWIGFLGALLAARSRKHLALSTGELIPEGRFRKAADALVNSISAGICALLAYAAFQLLVKAEMPSNAHFAIGIPYWWSESIMPAALALMALRFAWHAGSWPGRAIALGAIAGCCSLGLASAHAEQLVLPGLSLIAIGLLLGVPIFIAMAGGTMLLLFAQGDPIALVPTETYRLVTEPMLPAIPLFTAAGYVLAEGGASKRLVRLFRSMVGWLPGGMALAVCLVCAAFTAVTGGSGVTILAVGGLMLPMLLQEGYPEGFSLGLVTSSGSLGLLFPPSIPVILYAFYAKTSEKDLYIAGFLPCILLIALVAVYAIVTGIRYKTPRTSFSPGELARAVWGAKFEIAIPVVIVLSIAKGFATLVESAAISVLLAIVSQVFIFRDLHPRRDLPRVLEHASTLVGAVLILLGIAMGFTNYLVTEDVPTLIIAWTKLHIPPPVTPGEVPVLFLLALNAVLVVLGSVLEIYSAIVILAPLLPPLGETYHVQPLHMGIIFLANLELGFLFPPMGLNLILSSARFHQRLTRLYRVAIPFLVIMAAGVLMVTYVPQMTTGFLEWVKGPALPGGPR